MEQKKPAPTIPKIVIIFWIVGMGLLVCILAFPASIGSTDGSHTGVVTAVEYNSNIIWGASLVYFKTVRESSQEDIYCVNDQSVKEQLMQAQKDKKEVTVYFKNNFLMWKWQCNGGQTIIYKVE